MIRTSLHRLLNDERGTSITEFVICLPIFIITFIAMINMAEWGIESTAVRMDAQKELWADAIPVTSSTQWTHMSPISGAADAEIELIAAGSDTSDGARIAGYAYEGGAMVGLGLAGHWGESFYRTTPAQAHPEFAVDSIHTGPSDVTEAPFARKVIDDSLTDFDRGRGGNILDIVTEVVGSTGAFQSVAAGIRYGEAFGSSNRNVNLSVYGNENLDWNNDVLVAPKPLTGFFGTKVTFGMAWLLAQSQDNYYNLFVIGDGDGLSSSGTSSQNGNSPPGVPSPGDVVEDYNEENSSKDDRVGDAEDELEEQQEGD